MGLCERILKALVEVEMIKYLKVLISERANTSYQENYMDKHWLNELSMNFFPLIGLPKIVFFL